MRYNVHSNEDQTFHRFYPQRRSARPKVTWIKHLSLSGSNSSLDIASSTNGHTRSHGSNDPILPYYHNYYCARSLLKSRYDQGRFAENQYLEKRKKVLTSKASAIPIKMELYHKHIQEEAMPLRQILGYHRTLSASFCRPEERTGTKLVQHDGDAC